MSESHAAYVRYRTDDVDLDAWIGSPFGPGKTLPVGPGRDAPAPLDAARPDAVERPECAADAADDVLFPWDPGYYGVPRAARIEAFEASCTATDLGGWIAADDDPDMVLPPDEQAGLDALCAAVTEEIGDNGLWYGASDLAWIIESALFQAAQLIRSGQPLTLPNLGRFKRMRRAPPRTLPEACASNYAIDFEPDDMLLEDAL